MGTRTFRTVALALLAGLMMVPASAFAQAKEAPAGRLTTKAVELRLALHSLWGDHIFWVRNVVLTTKLGDKEAAQAAEDQVVQNAKDIASAIVPFYGKEAGDHLFTLLAGHYGAIKEYMTATFSANQSGMDAAMTKMQKNADHIATFLSSANPNWPKQAILSALGSHAAFHMAQIKAINAKDFSAEAKSWGPMKAQLFQIADVLASGIVKQFPEKFM